MDPRKTPEGFGDALLQNEDAANAFAMMTQSQKEAVLDKADKTHTKGGMRRLAGRIAKEQQIQ